jgi:DNA ligase (NAD+)
MSLAQDLNDLLVKARDSYYTGNPTMTDAEYDSKEAELKALDPNAPILKVVGDTKSTSGRVAHVRPMLSIENFYTKEEVLDWCKKINRG